MNVFAIPLFFVLWAIIAIIARQLLIKGDKRDYTAYLMVFIFLLIIYLRLALTVSHDFLSPDETVLKGNIDYFLNSKDILDNHSSGPGFILFIYFISAMSGAGTDLVVRIAQFIFPFFPVLLAIVALRGIAGRIDAGKAIALCFLSPLFLWPILEVRPEVFGLSVFFAIIAMLKKFFDTGKNKYCFIASALAICLGAVHIFSFFLAIATLIAVYWLAKRQQKKTGILFFTIQLSIIGFFVIFSLFSLTWDVHFAIRESLGLGGKISEGLYPDITKLHLVEKLKISTFIIVPTAALLIIFNIVTVFAKMGFTRRLLAKLRDSSFIKNAAVFLSVAVISSQIALQMGEINYFYGNVVFFAVAQSASFAIAFFAAKQMLAKTKKITEQTVLFGAIAGLAAVIGCIGAVSFFMRLGFNNFAIRTIPYIMPLLALVCLPALKNKKLIAMLLLVFPVVLIATVRDPSFMARIPFHERAEMATVGEVYGFMDEHSGQLKEFNKEPKWRWSEQDFFADKIVSTSRLELEIKKVVG